MNRPRLFPSIFVSVRYAKRRGVKMQREAKEKKNRPAAEVKEVKRGWLELALLKQSKAAGLQLAKLYPPRGPQFSDVPVKEGLSQLIVPEDDVWVERYYPIKTYSVAETIEMHRELMSPSIFNNPNGFVRLRLDLNMQTEKKTKFLDNMTKVISLPNRFDHRQKRVVLALVKDPTLQLKAADSGAAFTGGPEMIKKMQKGQFRMDEFDCCVCHTDMLESVVEVRGLMKKKFPSKKEGSIGEDIEGLVKHFVDGMQIQIKRDVETPQFGICDTHIATLDMATEQIEENIKALIQLVCQQRPVSAALGFFIDRAVVLVPPGKEFFHIPFWQYAPTQPGLKQPLPQTGHILKSAVATT